MQKSNRHHRGRSGGARTFNDEPKVGTSEELLTLLRRIDGSSYGAYKRAIGEWDYGAFKVYLDRVQSDPYAPPSALRVVANPAKMGLPAETVSTPDQQVATGDFLIRAFKAAIRRQGRGPISIVNTSQEILQRSAAQVTEDRVELRIQVQLPARGRTILGKAAATIFERQLPDVINETFDFWSQDATDYLAELIRHVHTYEDHLALQQALEDNGWVTFVNNGAVLPRKSGISELPMEDAVLFESPQSLEATVNLPHAGEVTGMAIRPGITLIVGGGYHGNPLSYPRFSGAYTHISQGMDANWWRLCQKP